MTPADFSSKRYWLVGAGDGLGEALAHRLSRAGAEVVVSARSQDRIAAVARALPGRASAVSVDIADTGSVKDAAAQIGDIDGLVLLAGVYWPFSARNWNAEQATAMADINLTGYMRVLGEVVPRFVERDAGHIVITSSLSAYRGLPKSIGYTASKAGTLSLAECMYSDLRQTGVRVQAAIPGFIKTRLTDKNDFHMPGLMTTDAAAQAMFELMCTDRFKRAFPTGFASVLRGAQFLPDWLYYRMFG